MRRWGLMFTHFPCRLSFLVVAVGVGACQAPVVVQPAPSASNGSGGSGGVGPGSGSDGPPMLLLPDAGPTPTPTPTASASTCATQVHVAELAPVDLLLLVDTSSSMGERSGTETKWDKARDSLRAFVSDPASAGLGVGMMFFPTSGADARQTCQQASDCTSVSPARPTTGSPCNFQGVCYAPGLPIPDRLCAPGNTTNVLSCPTGMTCVRRGTCSMTGRICGEGAPCDGGTADRCQLDVGMCQGSDDNCRVDHFGKPDVDVGDLPAQAGAITAALALRAPNGATPMVLAVESGFAALRARQMAFPDRRQVLVLSTDGLPSGCGLTQSVAAVVDRISKAQAATPAIPTYVVGVFGPQDLAMAQPALQMFAQRGGTGMPFLLSTGDDLNQRLLAALQKIRGKVVACEYTIPAPSMGALDFGKVNVRTTSQGATAELDYVTSADRCSADKGGWYYDNLPASATPPTRVIICPASCARLSGDSGAQVDLVFGCATRRID
jgi:hypothetical protein